MTFYPGGEHYEGEWSGGQRSGWGRMYYRDGSVYEGQWLEDQPGGMGMLRLRKYQPPAPQASACPLQGTRCRAARQITLPSRFLDATSHLPLHQGCGCSPVSSLPSRFGAGGSTRASVVLLEPKRMKADFCCDLHLNDWDG